VKKVYIWGWYSDYDLSSFNELEKKSCSIRNISMSKFGRLLLRVPIVNGIYFSLKKKMLGKLSGEKSVLFLSDDILYYQDLLESLVGVECKVIILIRNKINPSQEVNMFLAKEVTREIYTFDESDASNYNISFLEQYLPITYDERRDKANSNEKVAYFIGLEKGREGILNELSFNLKKENVICNFNIIRKSITRRLLGKSDGISYKENIDNVISSDFLVEINSKDQQGLTLRALEAVYYKKKLITNNINIRNFNFYNPDNIYILDDNLKVPKCFLLSEYDNTINLDLNKHLASNVYLQLMN